MKYAISYIHLLGVLPALVTLAASDSLEGNPGLGLIISCIFSWGVVLAGCL